MKKSLAFVLRPQTIENVIGQKHLINDNQGIISRMIKYNFATSLIFYGKPGIGKTSIALALANDLKLTYTIFNASLDKKSDLEKILDQVNNHQQSIIIVEEIHRMNKDRQDILLQAIEQGYLIMFACTTENPFFVINPALRSRSQIITLEPINHDEMYIGLKNIIKRAKLNINIEQNTLKSISKIANGDLRIALNIIELAINLYPNDKITDKIIENLAPLSNLVNDTNGDEHYDLLSALQKSIRGSNVDASLHYLSRLLRGGDFQSLLRRLLIIAYEDVGLANPIIPVKVKTAVDTFTQIGMPEGIIPLGLVVCEMALSEKSNSAYLAINQAINDVTKLGQAYPIPKHLRDNHYPLAKKLKHGINYKYPHNFPNHYVKQQYLPKEMDEKNYYKAQTHNLYEKKVQSIYEQFTKK